MFRKKEEIRIRKVEHAQKGPGQVYFHDFLLPEEAPGHGRVFSKVVIPPGSGIGTHIHDGEFEAFYVLAGEVTLNDNGETVVLTAGDMHLCKNGDAHGLMNNGEKDIELIALIMNDLTQ